MGGDTGGPPGGSACWDTWSSWVRVWAPGGCWLYVGGGELSACNCQQVTLPICAEILCPLTQAPRSNSKDKVPGQVRPTWIWCALVRMCLLVSRSKWLPSWSLVFRSVQSLSCVQLFATHGLQNTRLPCPLPTTGTYSDSCPSCRWCHPTISSSIIPFSSHLQSFPASGSFLMSRFFASSAKYWSFSFSISPSSDYSELIPLKIDWFDLLDVQETPKGLFQHHNHLNFSLF